MEMRRKQPIGVELVRRGVVTEADIEKALEYQRKNPKMKLGDILYELDVCDPNTLIAAMGEILGAKGILLTNSIIKININDYISSDIAKKNQAVPFDISNGKIKVCFPNTIENSQMNEVRLLLLNKGLVMEPYITFEQQIKKVLKSLDGEVSTDITLAGNNDNTSITELVDSIIKTGIERRASDIHIEPQENDLRIRYRIDGELYSSNNKKRQTSTSNRKIKSNIKHASRKTRSTRW